MARKVTPWVGKTDDSRVPPRVRLRIFIRADGKCELCKSVIRGGRWECDHTIALINGGENAETNLRCLCRNCHLNETVKDVDEKSKVARIAMQHWGIKKAKRPMPGSKAARWKRKMSGEVIER